MKRGIGAFVLSLIEPGLGQLFNGEVGKGLLFWIWIPMGIALCSVVPVWERFWGLVGFMMACLCWRVIAATEAGHTAYRQRRANSLGRRTWIAYALMAVILCFDLWIAPRFITARLGVRAYSIPSESMSPTIDLGDRLMASMRYYAGHPPQRGDLIIFVSPEGITYVKRAVALGGDTIQGLPNRALLVNGRPLDQPFLKPIRGNSESDLFGPLTVPTGQLFVLGDNRDYSIDSRSSADGTRPTLGTIPVASVIGRPLYFYWSPNRAKIGKSIE